MNDLPLFDGEFHGGRLLSEDVLNDVRFQLLRHGEELGKCSFVAPNFIIVGRREECQDLKYGYDRA